VKKTTASVISQKKLKSNAFVFHFLCVETEIQGKEQN
jgi:hypothetical protein